MTDPRSEGADDHSPASANSGNDLKQVESKWQQKWKLEPPRRTRWKDDEESSKSQTSAAAGAGDTIESSDDSSSDERAASTAPTDADRPSGRSPEHTPTSEDGADDGASGEGSRADSTADSTGSTETSAPGVSSTEGEGDTDSSQDRSSADDPERESHSDGATDSSQEAQDSSSRSRRDGRRGRRDRQRSRSRKGYYCLDMFPYPSMRGFSVNQLRGIFVTDIVARYQESKGRHVLRPIGWDSFGVSIEQEAQQRGLTPQQVVEHGIDTMRGQLRRLGARIDWDREVTTSDPEYYRWTQWIFLKLLEKGLAYRQEVPLKWCPNCKMNLANEEVEVGHCLHCETEAVERSTPQWMLRITDYAERLHQGLRQLKWPRRVKSMQRHWIGRREGYRLTLKLSNEFADGFEECDVFVRRLEWLPAATHLILAPEHPLVDLVVDELYRDDGKRA